MNTFAELSLSKGLHHSLTTCGFVTPTPVQAAAIPHGLSGKDIFATAQTGTGKTLAFLIPVIERMLQKRGTSVNTLVLVPTRELAVQVAEVYERLATRLLPPAALIMGGASERVQIQQVRNGARMVIATPGRLEDLISRRLVKLNEVETLILDEADRMLDMGFVPAIRRIVKLIPKTRQTMCFSATLDPSVVCVVEEILRNPVRLELGSTLKTADRVVLHAYEVDQSHKASLLAKVVGEEAGQSLIFVATKRSSERVAERLKKAGVKVAVIHGDRSQSQRNAALASFQDGKVQALVATDVASRGIHVDDIAQVVNYDLPKMPEDFVHRVGRTGRMGAIGSAKTFYTPLERHDFAKLERTLKIKMERIKLHTDLVREERGGQPVDASNLKLVAAGPKHSNRFHLEGEVLARYATTAR